MKERTSPNLSKRDIEMLKMKARGAQSKEIAIEFRLSRGHVKNLFSGMVRDGEVGIYAKLGPGIHNKTQAVIEAIRQGLFSVSNSHYEIQPVESI